MESKAWPLSPLSDTTPEARKLVIQLQREMSVWRKLQLMEGLNAMARGLVLSDLREQHPSATNEELFRLLADRLLGPELAQRVYGPLPDALTATEAEDGT